MKKNILLLFIFLLLNSCSIPHYVFQTGQTTGINFSSGKWLLNRVDAPYDPDDKLEKLVIKDFTEKLNDRLSYAPKVKGLLLPKKIGPEPSRDDLSNLKKITGFDYFINVKASNIKEEFGTMDVSQHQPGSSRQNKIEIAVEIYDLNSLQVVYFQKLLEAFQCPIAVNVM